jgi:hypothetical protein
MNKPTDWDPEQDLAVLLDGLTQELLGAPGYEFAPYTPETGDTSHDEADAMRRLIAAADAGFGVLPVSSFSAPGLRAFVTRNQ